MIKSIKGLVLTTIIVAFLLIVATAFLNPTINPKKSDVVILTQSDENMSNYTSVMSNDSFLVVIFNKTAITDMFGVNGSESGFVDSDYATIFESDNYSVFILNKSGFALLLMDALENYSTQSDMANKFSSTINQEALAVIAPEMQEKDNIIMIAFIGLAIGAIGLNVCAALIIDKNRKIETLNNRIKTLESELKICSKKDS